MRLHPQSPIARSLLLVTILASHAAEVGKEVENLVGSVAANYQTTDENGNLVEKVYLKKYDPKVTQVI